MAARPVVDAHSHFTPRAAFERVERSPGAFPHVGLRKLGEDKYSFSFPTLELTRPMSPKLWDVPASQQWLDTQGIDLHVVGLWSDLFGYDLPAEHWTGMVRGRGRAKEEMRVLVRSLRTRATPGHADSPLHPVN